jgi:hypothetical protein
MPKYDKRRVDLDRSGGRHGLRITSEGPRMSAGLLSLLLPVGGYVSHRRGWHPLLTLGLFGVFFLILASLPGGAAMRSAGLAVLSDVWELVKGAGTALASLVGRA